MMQKQVLLLFSAVLSAGLVASAQDAASTLAMEAAPDKEESRAHISVTLTGASNMHKQGSPDREAWTELTLNPSYSLSDETSLSVKSILTQEETQARNTLLSNTAINLKTKGPKLGQLDSSLGLTGVLPTDEEESQKNRFQGAVSAGGNLLGKWKNLAASYGAVLTRNFHEFSLNAESKPLVQYSLGQSVGLEVELNSKWTLSIGGVYKIGRTYRDFQRQTYGFETSLNYALSENLQASLGWSNEGKALRNDGTATNFQLYNENTSVIMAGVTFVN